MKKLLSIVVVVVVIILGAWFLSAKRLTPEQRLQAAFVNLVSASNGHLQAKVDIKTDPATSATLSEFKIATDGNFQKGNGGQLEADSNVTVEGSMTGASVIGKGAVRLVGGKLFYRLDEMPAALADISTVRGKWLPGTTNINLLPDAMRANLVKAFQKPQFFTAIKQLGKEKVGDVNATHLQTTFSASGYAGFVEEFTKMSGNGVVDKTALENGVKALNNVPFDVWLNPENKLRKIAVSYINPQNKANVNIELLFSNFTGAKIAEPGQSEIVTPPPATPSASPTATPAAK